MTIYERIKTLRLKKGLTLEQVGDYVGVSKATVLKWESGAIQNMRRDKIARLAQALGTTPEVLMGWGDSYPSPEITDDYSPHERKVIEAYRSNPAMQPAVDRLLGVAPEAPSEAPTVAEDIAATLSAAMEKSRVKK